MGISLSTALKAAGGDMNCPHIEMSHTLFQLLPSDFCKPTIHLPCQIPSKEVPDKDQGHLSI